MENNELLEKLNENTKEYYKLKEVCDEEVNFSNMVNIIREI